MDQSERPFEPPKYVVKSCLTCINDKDAKLEVRRYTKCFFLKLRPKNFDDSIKAEYLRHLENHEREFGRGCLGDAAGGDDVD